MQIIFTIPEYLWLLISLPVLIFVHFTTLQSTRRRAFKFANFEAIQRITGGEVLSKNLSLLLLRFIIIMFFIFAISGISITYEGFGSSYDFVIAIDNSNSMIVNDLTPTRLDAAKITARDFIDKISPDNKIGIVSFSSTSRIRSPLTEDRAKIKQDISEIDISDVGGTNIGEALVTSTNLLLASGNARSVVLITDGQSNVGIPIVDAVEYVNLRQITVYTIGIGTEQGANFFGSNLVLDEESLQNIAKSTSGKYFKVENVDDLNAAYNNIANSTQRKITQRLDFVLTILALFLLLFEWTLMNSKYRTIP
jgi:Ca-activated chloride channel family protein